jgi:hypothetical protein
MASVSKAPAFVEEGQQREEAKSLDEQGITGAFLKISKGIRKVCFVAGSKEHALDQTEGSGLSGFKTLLERDNYQPEAITLLDKNAVPDDCKVTVVAGPKADYTANEVTALKTTLRTAAALCSCSTRRSIFAVSTSPKTPPSPVCLNRGA